MKTILKIIMTIILMSQWRKWKVCVKILMWRNGNNDNEENEVICECNNNNEENSNDQ